MNFNFLKPGEIFRPPWSPDGLLMVKAGKNHAWTIDFNNSTSGYLIHSSYLVEYYTVDEVAQLYDVTPDKIREYIRSLPLYSGEEYISLFGRDLQPGDHVPVYADPANMTRIIGIGKLIEKVNPEGPTMERWRMEINGSVEELFIKVKRKLNNNL